LEGKSLEDDALPAASGGASRPTPARKPAVAMPRAKEDPGGPPAPPSSLDPAQGVDAEAADAAPNADGAPTPDAPEATAASPASDDAANDTAADTAADTCAVSSNGAQDSRPATDGEIAYLQRKIARRRLSVADARVAAGLASASTLEGLTGAGFAALKEALA
jgi:hypothetical protein